MRVALSGLSSGGSRAALFSLRYLLPALLGSALFIPLLRARSMCLLLQPSCAFSLSFTHSTRVSFILWSHPAMSLFSSYVTFTFLQFALYRCVSFITFIHMCRFLVLDFFLFFLSFSALLLLSPPPQSFACFCPSTSFFLRLSVCALLSFFFRLALVPCSRFLFVCRSFLLSFFASAALYLHLSSTIFFHSLLWLVTFFSFSLVFFTFFHLLPAPSSFCLLP